MLLDTEHTQLPLRSLLSPLWMGPFRSLRTRRRTLTASTSLRPGAPALSSTSSARGSTFASRTTWAAQRPRPDGRQEHEVQELVLWAGHDASGDTWEPLNNLTNCEKAITAFERATGSSLPRRAPPPPAAAAVPPGPPISPACFTVDLAPPGDLRATLASRTILYRWLEDGWQRGIVACLCLRDAFSWWRTPGRHWRCTARRTHCSTQPPTASTGCCSPKPLVPGSSCPPTRQLRPTALAGPPEENRTQTTVFGNHTNEHQIAFMELLGAAAIHLAYVL